VKERECQEGREREEPRESARESGREKIERERELSFRWQE